MTTARASRDHQADPQDVQRTDMLDDTLNRHPAQREESGRASAFFRKAWAIAQKEFRTELRAKEIVATMSVFGVLAVLIFALAFEGVGSANANIVAAGILWGVLFFSGVMGLNRSFGAEMDRGSLPALLLAPMDRSAIFFGKLLANFVFIGAAQLVVLPTLLVFFNVNLFRPWILLALGLGVLGYASVGTFFAALAAGVRARETLLPVMLLPVLVPLFVAGVSVTGHVLAGRGWPQIGNWMLMLALFDLIFVVVPYLVFDLIWQEG